MITGGCLSSHYVLYFVVLLFYISIYCIFSALYQEFGLNLG